MLHLIAVAFLAVAMPGHKVEPARPPPEKVEKAEKKKAEGQKCYKLVKGKRVPVKCD